MSRLVNLKAELENSDGRGLTVTVSRRMAVDMKSGDIRGCWAAAVERGRLTKNGRPGKPVEVLNLIASDEETPADLLRQLADLYEYGDVPVSS